MAKLIHLSFNGLRATCQASSFGAVTVIAGPNGSGKTTHVDALAAALSGSEPVASDPVRSEVCATFDGGVLVTQKWGKKRTAFVTLPTGGGPDGAKDVGAWCRAQLGEFREGGSAIVDLPAGQRQAAFLRLVRELPEGIPATAGDVCSVLGEVAVMALAKPTNEKTKPAPVPPAWDQCTAEQRADWLGAALKVVSSQLTMLASAAKTHERTATEASEAGAMVDGTYDEARAALDAAQCTLTEAESELAAVQRLGGTAEAVQGRILAAQAKRDEAAARGQGLRKSTEIAAEYDALIAEVRAQGAEAAAKVTEHETAERNAARLLSAVMDLSAAHARAEEALRQAQKAADAVAPGCPCPTCGGPLPAIPDRDRALAKVAQHERAVATARTALEDAQAQHEEAKARVRALADDATAASSIQADVQTEIERITAERNEKVREADAARSSAMADYRAARAQVEADEALLVGLPTTLDPELLDARVSGARAALRQAQDAMQAHEAAAERSTIAAEQRRRKAVVDAEVDALKRADATLTDWRAKLVTGAIESVMRAANDVAQVVWPETVFGCDNGADGVELWAEFGGRRLPVAAWPHSVRCTFALSAQVGIQNAERQPWRVACLDEAQALDPVAFRALVDALSAAVEHRLLDNAILVGALTDEHLRGVEGVPDVRVHRLGAPGVPALKAVA